MSGFSTEARGGSGKFAHFKEGFIMTQINGESKKFTHLEGHLIDIDIVDEEGSKKDNIPPYRKLVLYIDHGEGVTQLGIPFSSGYGHAFCCILPNIDPTKPVKISGGLSEIKGSERKYSSMFISQDDQPLKWYFKKGTKEGELVPAVKVETIGRGKSAKEVKDYSDREEFFERVIVKKLAQIEKVWGKNAVEKKEKEIKNKKKVDNTTEVIDDLPF